jgi:CDP-paratose 2-epimerase
MKPTLITGGAGFIGVNLAHRLLATGHPVRVLDSLARPGVERNLRWLREVHGDGMQVDVADIRDAGAVRRAVAGAGQVFHFAAQVAVTTSLGDPLEDFEVNARGTLNLLEAIRAQPTPPPLVFTSTNKVYGALEDIGLRRRNQRYEPVTEAIADHGVDESRPLDFYSPYGCSKGSADQYVRDYARSFGLPTVVFRMSCIYGPHQLGTEDQGWVAHFLIRALAGLPITIYGDGRQVRDLLYVDDLVDALVLAQRHMPTEAGQVFNIGGGPSNALSLLEVLDVIADLTERPPVTTFDGWRLGDQRFYVTDTNKFREATGWRPAVHVREGIARLTAWLRSAGPAPALAERG